MGTTSSPDAIDKTPRTSRGERTRRKLLDAAAQEFGENGFGETSISAITRRAGTALGSFYTYFDSKEAIFRALVEDLSGSVRETVASALNERGALPALDREREALASFLAFTRENKQIYRIIDEAEFVDNPSYRAHYENTAARILDRLADGMEKGELRSGLDDAHAWAIMGMYVFLGLRFGVMDNSRSTDDVAILVEDMLRRGIEAPKPD